jgi:N-acetyl-alpha-D-muramate 1-phosphate uridylyltransferase
LRACSTNWKAARLAQETQLEFAAMKVMLLAAGRGERLRPLTERLPKPMVEAGGKPLIFWQLERLATAGFRDVVINVSHFAERLTEPLGDGARFGLHIEYSHEAEPLETAGGIAWARERLGQAPFLLVNADVYCEFDFGRLRNMALGPHLVHLVLVPNPMHHPLGDFTLEAGRIGNGAAPRYTYAGIGVVSPALVAQVARGEKAPLAPLLRAAAERGLACGELYDGLWTDAGTAERLAALDTRLRLRHDARG